MPIIQVTPEEDDLLQGIANAIFKARKVVVVTGAGISTNSGIPDFRSENGLYSLAQAHYDAVSRERAARARRLSSSNSSIADQEERPQKRRKLSFEDSGIGLPSESSQITSDEEISGSGQESAENAEDSTDAPRVAARPSKRHEVEESREEPPICNTGKQGTPIESLRRSRRAQSLPPTEHPQQDFPRPTRHRPSSRTVFRTRGRSASPDPRPRHNTKHANSAELRKRSLLTSSLASIQPTGAYDPIAICSSPPRLPEPWPTDVLEDTSTRTDAASGHIPAPMTTPKTTTRYSSPLSSLPSDAYSSSPLSSPITIMSDPYVDRSSSTSQDSSSIASSETDETLPSSYPKKAVLSNIKGRDLFDVNVLRDDTKTSVFYTFITTLRKKAKDVQPTKSHHFIEHLRNRGKLVRCYSQNIDLLEEKVGLSTSLQEGPGHRGRFSRKSTAATTASTPPSNLVGSDEVGPPPVETAGEKNDAEDSGTVREGATSVTSGPSEPQPQRQEKKSGGVECVLLHGSLGFLRCLSCRKICAWDEEGRENETLIGRQPDCPHCAHATAAREGRGKRRLGVGKLRPDIVLYGEDNPSEELISSIVQHDLRLGPDLLLILGTSLKVHGLKSIVREFAKTAHSRGGKVVFVNFTKPSESSWGDVIDYWVQWDCDAWVSDLEFRAPLMWLPPGTKLPKKTKEITEKSKKRRRTTDEKPEPNTSKPCKKAGPSRSPRAHVEPERPPQKDNPRKPGAVPSPPLKTTAEPERPQQTETPPEPNAEPSPASSATAEPERPAQVESLPKPDAEPSLALSATAEPERPSQTENPPNPGANVDPDTSINPPQPKRKEPEPAKNDDVPKDAAEVKPKRINRADQNSRPNETTPPKGPQRPMAVREDRTSGAYYYWKIMADLSRITGNRLLVTSPLGAIQNTEPKPKKSRKSAPAVLSQPALPVTLDDAQASQGLHDSLGSSQPEKTEQQLSQPAPPVTLDNGQASQEPHNPLDSLQPGKTEQEQTRSTGIMGHVSIAQVEASSILDAVKLNPRKRKRKTIDGVEVSIIGTPRSVSASKTIPRPKPPKAKKLQRKEAPLAAPPKIISGLESAAMHTLKLAPLQMGLPNSITSKPPAMEPPSLPLGPSVELSPNSRIRETRICMQQKATLERPFSHFDALMTQLSRAPNWTPPRVPFMHNSFSRTNAEIEAAILLKERRSQTFLGRHT